MWHCVFTTDFTRVEGKAEIKDAKPGPEGNFQPWELAIGDYIFTCDSYEKQQQFAEIYFIALINHQGDESKRRPIESAIPKQGISKKPGKDWGAEAHNIGVKELPL